MPAKVARRHSSFTHHSSLTTLTGADPSAVPIFRPPPSRADPIVRRVILATLSFEIVTASLGAQSPFDSLHFRSIGPAATGGRIHDIEVDPKDPSTIYVASAS